MALSFGVSPEQYKTLNSYDLACLVRARQARERRWLEWLRWAVATIITPHYQKSVEPKKLFKFPDEKERVAEELQEMNKPETLEKEKDFISSIWAKEFGNKPKIK